MGVRANAGVGGARSVPRGWRSIRTWGWPWAGGIQGTGEHSLGVDGGDLGNCLGDKLRVCGEADQAGSTATENPKR
jgi:hypothetical protein